MSEHGATSRSGHSVLRDDPRFGFAWHLPASGKPGRPLLIAVHGSDRNWLESRDAFIPLAETCDLAILAPHFPADLTPAGGGHGYKFLAEPGIDYQTVLRTMLETFAGQYRYDRRAAHLFGFSGGAQFALRYALLNPAGLRCVILAAPGNVTLLDESLPWWAGVADVEARFGRPLDIGALRRMPFRLLVGNSDLAEGRVVHRPGEPYHSPHADYAGRNRHACIASLERSLRAAGVPASLETVPDVGHDFQPLAAVASEVLKRMLDGSCQDAPDLIQNRITSESSRDATSRP
jgi:pimeloyl-ACP methyl ester carboxylesterase